MTSQTSPFFSIFFVLSLWAFLLEDFEEGLDKWKLGQDSEYAGIADGALKMQGVVRRQDPEQGIQGTGVSPTLIYKERTFGNLRISFDVRLQDVALTENWAGAFFHSGGDNGFWEDGGYLVYVTNLGNLVL